MGSSLGIAVDAQRADRLARADELARELGLPRVALDQPGCDVQLVVTDQRLELREAGTNTGPVYVEFTPPRQPGRRGAAGSGRGARDPLVRAVGKRSGEPWSVADCTAGLGRDAFVLAMAGCRVTAVERSSVLAALLEDGLRRAMQLPELQAVLGERLRLVRGDAREVLAGLSDAERPDAVYIDPMFPQRAKSAASKKEMRLTRLVAGEDPDAAELLEIARQVARHRVVVKRWLHAPPLGPRPAIQYEGQSIRYDVYLRGSGG